MTSRRSEEDAKVQIIEDKVAARLKRELSFLSVHRNVDLDLQTVEKDIEQWWTGERWAHTRRNYSAKDVAALRPSIDLVTPTHYLSKKLYWTLRKSYELGTCSKTYGALDNVQAINMCKYLSSIYVSGW
jgi:isocitrate lyase